MTTAQKGEDRIAELAGQIRSAAEYLTRERGYTLVDLKKIAPLHKNSLMRIKDLRIGYVVPRIGHNGKLEWMESPRGATGSKGRWQWLWNPQISTFAALKKLNEEVRREDWEASAASNTDQSWQAHG
jgi:hypothetical protein